jgi:uncharacterized SAM-binding protein YcdF (DUF218 family)
MTDWVVLRKLIAGFVLPPTGPLLCAVLGLVLARWRPRVGKALVWVGVCSLLAFSLPVVSKWLVHEAGGTVPLDLSRPLDAQAIVILGGGIRPKAAEYGRDTLSLLTLERVRYGAFVARKTGLPLLVTGGVVFEGEPEAELMRDALQDEFGLPVRWVEPRSRNTHENALYSAATLKASGVSRIVVVSHVFDARRARIEFESAGLQVILAPTGTGLLSSQPLSLVDFLPSARALLNSYYACYEFVALLGLHLFGR